MVSVGLIWRRAFLTLRVGFGFDEKGRPKMNLIASGAVAAFRFAFLVLPREEPSNIATLEGGVVLVPGCGHHAGIDHILIRAVLRSRCSFGPFLIAHQQSFAGTALSGGGRARKKPEKHRGPCGESGVRDRLRARGITGIRRPRLVVIGLSLKSALSALRLVERGKSGPALTTRTYSYPNSPLHVTACHASELLFLRSW